MKLITVDVKKETFDVSAVEGSSNSLQIQFVNTPDEWRDDDVGVYVLYSKNENGVIYSVNKDTMISDVPNSMVAENGGFKATLYAMNSDTVNPYRYPLPPIWIEVLDGYEYSVSSAPDKDNMDAISTLIQVLLGYDQAEAQRKTNEEQREENELIRNEKIIELDAKVNNNLPDLSYNKDSEKPQSGIAVSQALASLVDSAPEALNTLEELARALGNDPNFATTIMEMIGKKVEKDAYNADMGIVNQDIDDLEEDLHYHKNNSNNPHRLTKDQIGLGNVDNTADKDKPVSDAVSTELNKKVDKVTGKGLSTNDFTNEYKNRVNEFNRIIENGIVENDRIAYSIEEIDDEYMNIPTVEVTKNLINPTPIETVPTTLEANKQYNFGEKTSISLAFPTQAIDGDVIYLTFKSGNTPTALTIDTTNTCDIECIPEANTGYEIFGKFNGEIWIVNYSEYTVSEG